MEQMSLFSFSARKARKKEEESLFLFGDLPVLIIRRPYERAFYVHVTAGKVKLVCSRRSGIKEIRAFLTRHESWIQKQLLEQKKLRKRYPVKKFKAGELFLFQGKNLKLRYEKAFLKTGTGFFHKEGYLVYIYFDLKDLNRHILHKRLRDFYKNWGTRLLKNALSEFSSRMKLFPRALRIGSQKSLWGSCSEKGSVSLNWRLAAAPGAVLEYVVIHELAHLRRLNHSKSFWALVSRFCPEYKKQEAWLKNEGYAMDFLLPRSELHTD